MSHIASREDKHFQRAVESCEFPVSDFDHRAHLRLAYIYLVDQDIEGAVQRMRETLLRLLQHVGVDPSDKFHETLTKAWVLAVYHFMNLTETSESADEFIDANPVMLDSKIMLTHYSAEVLFSDEARRAFVEPNLEKIPRHGNEDA
ncbi:hypothetical protein [Parahaliea mediterranea]|uniref:Uncharacterized protein n=1 Tax=Parahaliea mediterranea TaxID=651086 RepID=A0A939DDX9_9GAMM|nr:hypothetical protein [Parahaliea mediterranea]MBN7796324.1 hypothetical protein [Parahaliea mediterranea]